MRRIHPLNWIELALILAVLAAHYSGHDLGRWRTTGVLLAAWALGIAGRGRA